MFQVLVVKCRYQTRVLFGEYLIFAGSDLGLFEVGFLEVGIFGAEIMDGKTGDLGEHLMNKGYRFQICWLFDELRRVLALMPWCFASPSQLLSYLGILSLQNKLMNIVNNPRIHRSVFYMMPAVRFTGPVGFGQVVECFETFKNRDWPPESLANVPPLTCKGRCFVASQIDLPLVHKNPTHHLAHPYWAVGLSVLSPSRWLWNQHKTSQNLILAHHLRRFSHDFPMIFPWNRPNSPDFSSGTSSTRMQDSGSSGEATAPMRSTGKSTCGGFTLVLDRC